MKTTDLKNKTGQAVRWSRLMIASAAVGLAAVAMGQMSSRYGRSPSYGSSTPNSEFQAKYGVLLERNIFLKDRRKAAAPTPRPNYTQRLSPEQTMVLTGIVLEDGQLRAYVEDRARGKVQKLTIGDAIATGHVSDIQIDAIAYENSEGKIWVNIGKTLSGGTLTSEALLSNLAGAGVGAEGATTAPAGGDASLNTGNLSIEERLKLRRLQQTGGPQK